MENASKALIMAAGVLIGVILLSLMSYMFISFAMSSAEIHKENAQNQLNEFNSQFTSYMGKEGVTIYDVVTVANLATESNIYYEFQKKVPNGNDNYIAVKLNNNTNLGESYNNKNIEKGYEDNRDKQSIKNYYDGLIKIALNNDMIVKDNNEKTLRQYNCDVKISPITGRVYLVTFTPKP